VNTVFKEYESSRMECWFRHKWGTSLFLLRNGKIGDFIPTA
jgi:hypothetical protein